MKRLFTTGLDFFSGIKKYRALPGGRDESRPHRHKVHSCKADNSTQNLRVRSYVGFWFISLLVAFRRHNGQKVIQPNN